MFRDRVNRRIYLFSINYIDKLQSLLLTDTDRTYFNIPINKNERLPLKDSAYPTLITRY